jgi:predicted HicB family RNase H-like nuclease
MFRYRNYIGKPEVDTETRAIHGRLLNITDVIEFEGSTVEQAEADFRRAVDTYLKVCEDQGKEPEKPFSGKLPFRTSPEIHRDIYIAASRADRSINAWMEDILCHAARSRGAEPVKATEAEIEPSIAEYRYLLTQLQDKINLLQDRLSPYLRQETGIFPDLLNDIKPVLKDRDLPDLIEKVESISKRLESIRDQEALLLSFIEKPVQSAATDPICAPANPVSVNPISTASTTSPSPVNPSPVNSSPNAVNPVNTVFEEPTRSR